MIEKGKIKQRCDEILKLGREIRRLGTIYKHDMQEFQANVSNIYHIIFNDKVPNYYDLKKNVNVRDNKKHSVSYTTEIRNEFEFDLNRFEGFVKDFKSGLLNSLENIITIETYGSMSEYIKELNSYDNEPLSRAACVLSRLMLEDILRKLCRMNEIEIEEKTKAATCNDLLKKENIYSKTQHKHITAWLGIGNAAAHPDSDFLTITDSQKDDMIRQVEEFGLKYLS